MLALGGVVVVILTCIVAAVPASAAAPRPGDAVPGRYVVTLDPSRPPGALDDLARAVHAAGGRVVRRYDTALQGLAATSLRPAAATALAHAPLVGRVEPDRWYGLAETQRDPPWGLDRIDQRARPLDGGYTYDSTASNVEVYVIDTGIRTTHAEFEGRATLDVNEVPDGRSTDCNGHGTHVAGIVGGRTYGVAKAVRLHAVRVIGCAGLGLLSAIVAGIDWVSAHHATPAVANMSIGGLFSPTINAAVHRSIAAGVTYAVAAGNFGIPACWTSPAAVRAAITVGASTSDDVRAGFSNWGSCVDLFAPGVDIPSAWNGGDEDVAVASGTSMATPHAAGAAALYLAAHPAAAPGEVRDALVAASTRRVLRDAPLLGSPSRLLFAQVP